MKIIAACLFLLCISLIYVMPLLAQIDPPPPVFPSAPEQAPLGGLGMLALAAGGGAYAWKKLRGLSE